MEDLTRVDTQFTIFCSFILNPDSIMKTVDKMQQSRDKEQQDRAVMIYKIIASYFEGRRNFRVDMGKVVKDAKLRKVANQVEEYLVNTKGHHMQMAKARFKVLQEKIQDTEKDMIITREVENPIEHSDLVFLNQLAAITANTMEDVNKLTQFSDRYYKQRIRDLYHKNPYYFEQAFCNTDILVQERILNILESESERSARARDEKKKAAYEFLEELYLVSSIDTKMLKSNAKFTKDKAFESFLKVIQNKEKSKTTSILINDDSIMKAILDYKYNNKGSLSTLKHLFINTRYPYNRILLEKYTKLMKRTAAGLRKDLQLLTADEKFAEAYNKFSKIEDIEILKENSAAFVDNLDEMEPCDELLFNISQMIKGYCEYIEPIDEILSVEEMKMYIAAFFRYVVKHKLYFTNAELTKTIDDYFVKCVSNEFYLKKSADKFKRAKNATSSIGPDDMWFEVNRVLYMLGDHGTKKVYLKFPDATYEFVPYRMLHVSDNMMMRSDMKSLPEDELGVDITLERIKTVEIYMNQIYQRIVEKAVLKDININVSPVQTKGMFKKTVVESPDELYEEDAKQIQTAIVDFMAMWLLIQKDKEMFVNRYLTTSPEILRNIYKLNKSYKVIHDNITAQKSDYVLNIFKIKKHDMEQLHNDIRKYSQNNFMKGVYETMDRYLELIRLPDRESGLANQDKHKEDTI